MKHQIKHFEDFDGKFDNIDFVGLVSASEKLYSQGLDELDSESLLELEKLQEELEDETDIKEDLLVGELVTQKK